MTSYHTDEALRALALAGARLVSGAPDERSVAQLLEALRRFTGDAEQGVQLAVVGADDLQPSAKVERARAERQVVRRVFRHWQQTTKHPRSRLTPERSRAVLARLRDGYTEAEIMTAIDGAASSEFHAGQYDDLTLICRNGSKLERFRDMGSGRAGWTDYEQTEASTEESELRRQIAEAMRDGDHEKYEEINGRLRAILG